MTFFHDFWRNCTSRCIGYGDSMNNVFVYIRTDRGYTNRRKNIIIPCHASLFLNAIKFEDFYNKNSSF